MLRVPSTPVQRITAVQMLLYGIIRFTAQLTFIPPFFATLLNNLVHATLWKAGLKSKWTRRTYTLRSTAALGFGIVSPETLIDATHLAQVAMTFTNNPASRTTARLLQLDLKRWALPPNPFIGRPPRGYHPDTWRLSGLQLLLAKFCTLTDKEYTYLQVINLPLHNCIFFKPSTLPTTMQVVGDVVHLDNSTNRIGHLLTPAEIRNRYGAGIKWGATRTFRTELPGGLADFMINQAPLQTLTIATPRMDDDIREATVGSTAQAIRQSCDLLEQKRLQDECPVDVACVPSTSRWWKRLPQKDRHFQFKYTIRCLPTRDRLAHIITANPTKSPTFNRCRHCHIHKEKPRHLFEKCSHATAIRTQWTVAHPTLFQLTKHRRHQLWHGTLYPWLDTHPHRSALLAAASAAIKLRHDILDNHPP
jgi:hypothetical protein